MGIKRQVFSSKGTKETKSYLGFIHFIIPTVCEHVLCFLCLGMFFSLTDANVFQLPVAAHEALPPTFF